MPEVLLSSRSTDSLSALRQCGLQGGSLSGRNSQAVAQARAHTPYIIGGASHPYDQLILNELGSNDAAKNLTDLTNCFGGDTVPALAAFQQKFYEFNLGLVGTSSAVYTDRVSAFVKAVESHQTALLDYRDAARSGSPLAQQKKFQAQRTFERLQVSFRNELRILNAGVRARRGTPLTSFDRGANIARDSRHADKLFIRNQAEAHLLVRMTRHVKLLGNGLAVIDFGSRIGKVHNSYEAGGNWHRELFVQSSSFTAGALSAALAVKGGLALLAVFTPVGLVGLLVGSGAIALGAAGGAMAVDTMFKSEAGAWYDEIMNWLDSL